MKHGNIHSVIHSCSKCTCIPDLCPGHRLGTEGAATINSGPLQSGGKINVSMNVSSAVGEAPYLKFA